MALLGGSEFKWTSHPSDSTVRSIEIKISAGENWEIGLLGATAIIALGVGSVLLARSKREPACEGAGLGSNPSRFSWMAFVQNLRKSAKDCQIGGVCGGLGEHSPIPSLVWRMLFLILMLCFGTGVLAYIILWICMPRASSPNAGRTGTGEDV